MTAAAATTRPSQTTTRLMTASTAKARTSGLFHDHIVKHTAVAPHKPQAHPQAGVECVARWPRPVGEYLFRRSTVYAANVGRSINVVG